MDYQVTCIVPHGLLSGRIQAIGGPEFGVISEDTAIDWIETGIARFYTLVGFVRAALFVVRPFPGEAYLTTSPDGYLPNNLLHLPRCPGW
jgi:hypothetical protein